MNTEVRSRSDAQIIAEELFNAPTVNSYDELDLDLFNVLAHFGKYGSIFKYGKGIDEETWRKSFKETVEELLEKEKKSSKLTYCKAMTRLIYVYAYRIDEVTRLFIHADSKYKDCNDLLRESQKEMVLRPNALFIKAKELDSAVRRGILSSNAK